MRIVYWNIRAGGGVRAAWIADQLERWKPDVIGLGEFRGTEASRTLAARLADSGWPYQLDAVDTRNPAANAVFLASSSPLRRIHLRLDRPEATRWLLARRNLCGTAVGVLYAPNYVTGRKRPFLDALSAFAKRWRGKTAVFGGDSNCGIPPLDGNPDAFHDWECAWIPGLEQMGWCDAYRQHDPAGAVHTWYSPNAGNGYRLDQAFLSRPLRARLGGAQYRWGLHEEAPSRRDALSDHAALLVDLRD